MIEHERGNNGRQGDKEHRSDLCGRCKSGRPCRSARFQARQESSDEESSEEEYSDDDYSEESVTDLMYGMNLNEYESSEEEQYYDPYENYYDEY